MQPDTTLARSMEPVIDAIGFDAALRLVTHFGGTRVLIVADPQERDPVSRAVGTDCARRLGVALGAGLLDVPRCMAWMLARRNEEIAARRRAGETQAELALRFGMTERHVRRVLALDDSDDDSTTADGRIGDLFSSAEEGARP